MPKLSIITINYNNLPGLQKTMQSVFAQSFTDYEYIIIDGGSTDGSEDLIKKHENKLVYWVSEKDKGIYNAMNKGIKQSKGEYLLFLNSGDFLIRESVLSNLFSNKIDTDLVYCDVLWCEGDKIWEGNFPSKLTLKYFVNASLPHQATLVKRELFDIVGLYDETIKISSDWKFFVLAIYMYKCTYSKINLVFVQCDRMGISCKPEAWPVIVSERDFVLKKYFGPFYNDIKLYNDQEDRLKQRIIELEKDQRMIGLRLHKKINKILNR